MYLFWHACDVYKKKGKHTKNKQKYRKDKKTNIHVNTREKRLITRFISMSKLETLTFFFFFLSLPSLHRCNESNEQSSIESKLSSLSRTINILIHTIRNNPWKIHTFCRIFVKEKRGEGGRGKIVMEFRNQILMRFSNQANSKGGATLTWKHPLTWQGTFGELRHDRATLRNYDFE